MVKLLDKDFGMGIAKFNAKNPHTPSSKLEELYNLLDDMDGILDWTVNMDGKLAIEYDYNRIHYQVIMDALSSTGFRLKHISDDPNVSDYAEYELLDKIEV
jgi:hypothetical protein